MPQIPPPHSTATKRTVGPGVRRLMQLAWCALGLLWFIVSDAMSGRAARGLAARFDIETVRPLLAAAFLIFLLGLGFRTLAHWQGRSIIVQKDPPGLPRRPTAAREWSIGIALGWGAAVAAVLPMVLTLRPLFFPTPRAWLLGAVNLATLALTALAMEMALRGYSFRRLIDALGPSWAVVAACALAGTAQALAPASTAASIVVTMLFNLLLCLAWLRTHGLWLSWGLRLGWNVSIALLFGLPLGGVTGFAAIVETRASGHSWLTGGGYGPEGAWLTAAALLVAIVPLFQATDDYAWEYTRPAIMAAGYDVSPAPPAAHVAMEQSASRPPVLVQIAAAPPPKPVD